MREQRGQEKRRREDGKGRKNKAKTGRTAGSEARGSNAKQQQKQRRAGAAHTRMASSRPSGTTSWLRIDAMAMRRTRIANSGCTMACCTMSHDMARMDTFACCSCSTGGSRWFTNIWLWRLDRMNDVFSCPVIVRVDTISSPVGLSSSES